MEKFFNCKITVLILAVENAPGQIAEYLGITLVLGREYLWTLLMTRYYLLIIATLNFARLIAVGRITT